MSDKAVIVGINAYFGCPLQNCVNDMKGIADYILANCGFAMENIRLLSDDRATTLGIMDRLDWLTDDYQPGDRRLFYYSGHGSQLADRDGVGNLITIHDCICPVDFDFTKKHAITDDGFRDIFESLPSGALFYWCSDSCHSGDLARGMNPARSRAFPMPEDYAWRIHSAEHLGLEAGGFARAIEHLHGSFISGCKSNQTSSDGVGKNGAFTESLIRALGSGCANMCQTNLVAEVCDYLQQGHYDQEPQIHGEDQAITRPWLSKI